MKNAYQNISDMNTAFGNIKGLALEETAIKDAKIISDKGVSRLVAQARNLYDELDELRDDGFTVLRKDPNSTSGRKEMFDAIADLIVFLYGVGHFVDIPINKKHDWYTKRLAEEFKNYSYTVFYEKIYEEIKSMIDELIAAIEHKDVELIDLFMHRLNSKITALCLSEAKPGYDLDLLIDRVTESNMSKLCRNDEELEATLKFYRDKGVEVYSKESPLVQESGKPYLVVYSAKEQTDADGKVYRADKFLKNINWFEPDITDF